MYKGVINLPVPMMYIGSLVLMLMFFALGYLHLPPQIPLFYSLPNGNDQVVDTWIISVIPVLSLLCIMMNTYMVKKVLKNNAFIAEVSRVANVVMITMSTYIFVKIIVLVTF